MTFNIPGLVAIIVFYLLILGVGIWSAWRRRKLQTDTDEVMLAGRSIGGFVGLLTLTATWVGGGYINGSAEAVYTSGLVWCQAPIGYSISLSLGGMFFARKMRDAGYVTMLDPLQDRFGTRWGSFLFVPALAGEMLWSAAILAALGSTLVVILDIEEKLSIIVSAAIAVVYTLFGGLASVAHTDVVQLFCIFIGLWVSIPFAWTNENVGSLALNETDWLGTFPTENFAYGEWIDIYCLLIFGGIPWQVYFQRVLSARTSRQAQVLSYAASLGCIIMVIPAVIIGAIAKAADWESSGLGRNLTETDHKMVLPLVLQFLTPTWVAFLGLGAVSAAVMSSADSSVLSSSSMFAWNIYKNVFRPKASEREIVWVMRAAVIVVASASCSIAINTNSVYDLFYLCGDLVYVMLFPQLAMTVHCPNYVNVYGSIVAYWVGLTIRLLGGEPKIGLPATIKFWFYNYETNHQVFPFRTLAMLVSLILLLLVSAVTKWLFKAGKLQERHDILRAFSSSSTSHLSNEKYIEQHRNNPPGRGHDNPALETDFDHRHSHSGRPVETSKF